MELDTITFMNVSISIPLQRSCIRCAILLRHFSCAIAMGLSSRGIFGLQLIQSNGVAQLLRFIVARFFACKQHEIIIQRRI